MHLNFGLVSNFRLGIEGLKDDFASSSSRLEWNFTCIHIRNRDLRLGLLLESYYSFFVIYVGYGLFGEPTCLLKTFTDNFTLSHSEMLLKYGLFISLQWKLQAYLTVIGHQHSYRLTADPSQEILSARKR